MFLAYRVLTTFFYPFLIFFMFIRKLKKKEDPIRYKEKIFPSSFNVKKNSNLKLIWFHAASIGEFRSIIPIIEKLAENKFQFLITTTTLSSSTLASEELKKFDNTIHRFLPLDVNFLINKFITLWKPSAIFLVDSEIWPNLIFSAKKYKIPIALINARITSKTFKRWIKFPKTAEKIFNSFSLCLTSNVETKNFLLKLKGRNIFFCGNIKLINKIIKKNKENIYQNTLPKIKFWLAASTHEEEEIFCLKVHLKLKETFQDIKTVIAPRHIVRVSKVKNLCEKLNLNFQVLDKKDQILTDKELIIVNSFGVLNNFYEFAKSVFIGKSLIKKLKNDGGQNPIDAAKFDCKIYHGPYVYNFEEIYEILEKNQISKKVENVNDLASYIINDFNSQTNLQENTKIIEELGEQTLTNTIKNINSHILNEI